MKDSKTNQGNPIDLDQLSTAELERLLQNDFLASRGQTDPEFVAAAMEVIARRKDKPAPEVDVDAAWETFRARMKQEHRQEEASPELPPSASPEPKRPQKRRWLRRTVAAAAVVAVLVCLSIVPVQGTSLLGTLVGWTDDTVSFQAKNENSKNTFFNDAAYQQVAQSISNLTNQPILPTWYPEGCSLIRVEENRMDDGSIFTIVFSLDRKEFILTVGTYNSSNDLPIYKYEKNSGSVEEYYVNDIPHYIMSNIDRNSVTWRNENTECSIQGFLPVDTLKQMIDSIYS